MSAVCQHDGVGQLVTQDVNDRPPLSVCYCLMCVYCLVVLLTCHDQRKWSLFWVSQGFAALCRDARAWLGCTSCASAWCMPVPGPVQQCWLLLLVAAVTIVLCHRTSVCASSRLDEASDSDVTHLALSKFLSRDVVLAGGAQPAAVLATACMQLAPSNIPCG